MRAEEGGLSTERNGGRRRWSWGMWSKSWAVYVELPVRGGLELASLATGHKDWSLSKAQEFLGSSQFLKVKDFGTLLSPSPKAGYGKDKAVILGTLCLKFYCALLMVHWDIMRPSGLMEGLAYSNLGQDINALDSHCFLKISGYLTVGTGRHLTF